jgi:hypothetical protein
MNVNEEMIEGIKEIGKQKKGMSHLIHYLEGNELTQRQAIHAYCYHCSGYGQEEDCGQSTCPLYPFAPYSSHRRIVRKKKDVVTASTKPHSVLNRVSGVK